jgi:hypothetical protein
MEKSQPLQQMLLGKLDICMQNLKLCLSPCTSINSKWIKDLNIKPETLNLVQERAGNILEHVVMKNNFLNRTQMAQQLRERIDKWDEMELKCSAQQKKLKRLPTEWEKCQQYI